MRLNQAKNQKITSSIQGLLGKDSELKYLAQRAVVSYLRSVHLQPNKDVFDVDALDGLETAGVFVPLDDFLDDRLCNGHRQRALLCDRDRRRQSEDSN